MEELFGESLYSFNEHEMIIFLKSTLKFIYLHIQTQINKNIEAINIKNELYK
jgi:hypothetical protein